MARRNRNRKNRRGPLEAQAKLVPPAAPPRERPQLSVLEELKILRGNTRKMTANLDTVRRQIGLAEHERSRACMHEDCAATFIAKLHDEAKGKVQTFVEDLVASIMSAGVTAHEETQRCLTRLQEQETTLDAMHLTCARAIEQTLCLEVKLADLEQSLQVKPAV